MSKLHARLQRDELERAKDQAVATALLRGGRVPDRGRSAAGDERRLRGIPLLGACPGAIPGTRPDTQACR